MGSLTAPMEFLRQTEKLVAVSCKARVLYQLGRPAPTSKQGYAESGISVLSKRASDASRQRLH